MSRTEVFQIRLTPEQKERLRQEAQRRDISMARVLTSYINRLPKPQPPQNGEI